MKINYAFALPTITPFGRGYQFIEFACFSYFAVLILSAFDGIFGVITYRIPPAHHEPTTQLISHYFTIGYKYKEILVALLVVHGMKLSLRHLKRLLKTLNLRRMTAESPIDDIIRVILQELSGSGKCIGYKTMWKRLKLNSPVKIRKLGEKICTEMIFGMCDL